MCLSFLLCVLTVLCEVRVCVWFFFFFFFFFEIRFDRT